MIIDIWNIIIDDLPISDVFNLLRTNKIFYELILKKNKYKNKTANIMPCYFYSQHVTKMNTNDRLEISPDGMAQALPSRILTSISSSEVCSMFPS